MDETTNPETEVETSEVEQEPVETSEVETSEAESEAEEQEEQEVSDDGEEIEYEGAKYKVPAALKDAFLRQADYTRKTQEVAENKRTLENERKSFEQAVAQHQQHIKDVAALVSLEQQLEQFKKVDWDALTEEDPVQALKLDRQYRQLAESRAETFARIQQEDARRTFEAQQSHAKRIEQGQKALKAAIPDWSDEKAGKVAEYARSIGYSDERVARIVDPGEVIALHKAMAFDQMMRKAQKPAAEQAVPAAKVKTNTPVKKDPERMSDAEWAKARRNQSGRKA